MVVVDYSVHDRFRRRNDHEQLSDSQRRQQLLCLDEDAAVDVAVANFCPRLRRAVSFLSRHKVGPLQQRVHLSDFQCSTTPSSLPTDGFSSSMQPHPRNDRFILSIPYLCEELPSTSGHGHMVRWSIIAQCNCPDKAPDVILLPMDNLSVVSGQGEATLRRSHNNQRPQALQRRQYQTIQERFWQQYVASEVFHIPCLTNWNKMNNDNSSSLLYCILANQLYECYANFQVYKLKMSLKSTPAIIQPPPHLILAFNQYKQLIKLSKSVMTDDVTTDINVELFTNLEGGTNYEDRRNQTNSSAFVCIRAIISIVSSDQTASDLTIFTENNENKVLIHLASVTTIFTPTSGGCSNKNSSPSNITNGSLNKKYVVRILNPKLSRTTQQGAMMIMMLDATTEQCLDTTMIDFVTYVRRVQHAAIHAYNCEISNAEENMLSSNENHDNSIQLLFEALNKALCCDSSPNGNCLLDYQISNQNTCTKNTTNFIRYLLVDTEIMAESTQLKYILTVEYNMKVCKEYQITSDEENTTSQVTSTKLVPIVGLRSIYDDENSDHYLNIDIGDIKTEADMNNVNYNDELATIIKTATMNGIRKLRQTVVKPVLTRYHKQWSPIDNYFASSITPLP